MAKQKTIVDQLREAIRKSGLTHYAIGKRAGINPNMLDRFVSGERDLRFATVAKIATVLALELTKRNS